jgi:hypothetical protein
MQLKVEYVNHMTATSQQRCVKLHCFRYVTSYPACFIHSSGPVVIETVTQREAAWVEMVKTKVLRCSTLYTVLKCSHGSTVHLQMRFEILRKNPPPSVRSSCCMSDTHKRSYLKFSVGCHTKIRRPFYFWFIPAPCSP